MAFELAAVARSRNLIPQKPQRIYLSSAEYHSKLVLEIPRGESRDGHSREISKRHCQLCHVFFDSPYHFETHKLRVHINYDDDVRNIETKKEEREEQERRNREQRAVRGKAVEQLRQEYVAEEEKRRVKADKKRERRLKEKKAKEKKRKRQEKMERKAQQCHENEPRAGGELGGTSELWIHAPQRKKGAFEPKADVRWWSESAKVAGSSSCVCSACNIRFTTLKLLESHTRQYSALGLRHSPVYAYPSPAWFERLKKGRAEIAEIAKAEDETVKNHSSPDGNVARQAIASRGLSQGASSLRISKLSRIERASRLKDKGAWSK